MLAFEMLQTLGATFPDGFTVDKNTFQPITKGFSVAVAEHKTVLVTLARPVLQHTQKHTTK